MATQRTPSLTVPDLTMQLQHAARVLNSQLSAALDEIGSSGRTHCVLAHAMEAERTQNQLAEAVDMDKTTMVVTLDAMERAGLAERHPSPADRRARIVVVTPAGADLVDRGVEIVDRVHQAVLDALPKTIGAAFADGLARLNEGHLAAPPEAVRPARRARQARPPQP
jgi:DNA-binding MarR family transcriptional regulator